MLTLYHATGSCALASRLCLEYAGADYRAVRIDLKAGQQRSPEYLKINPKGRVPALVTARGVLTETPAILHYIAQTHPAAQLAPLDDAYALAKVNEFNTYLCSTVHVAHAHRTRPERWADDEAAKDVMRAKSPANVIAAFEYIEGEFQGPWVMGEALTSCDFYLFTVAGWLEGGGIDVARFPKTAQLRRRVAELPRVARVLADL